MQWRKIFAADAVKGNANAVSELIDARDTKTPGRFLCRVNEALLNYASGPAATRALPASLPVYLVKFFTKREARSFALVSHSVTSA